MRASIVSSLVFLASTAQLASAGFSDALQFQCPGNTVNQCNSQQSSGFDWSTLGIGSFSSYGDFDFSGYTCANKFGKRDLLTGRSFQSKCITGTASYDEGSSPSFSCGSSKSVSAFSVTEFQISVEVDIDLEFHYGMSDGSVCKQKSSCKASGSTIKNTQCGGAKGVTVVIPKGSGNGKGCGYGIHSIGFDCSSKSSTVVKSTTLKTTTKTTTTQATTTSTTVAPAVTTSTTTAKGTTSTSSTRDCTTSATTTSVPLAVPVLSSSSSSAPAPGTTTSSSTTAAGTTTTAPSAAPSTSSPTTAAGTTTAPSAAPSTSSSTTAAGTTTAPSAAPSTSSSTTAAGTTTTAPSAAPSTSSSTTAAGTTTTAPSVAPSDGSTAPGTTTSTIQASPSSPPTCDDSPGSSNPCSSSPPESSAPATTGSTPPTTAAPELTTSTVFTTLVSTIISCGPEVKNCPGRSTVLTTMTVPLFTTICPVAATTAAAPPPPPPPPAPTSPCPDVLPRCLSTWMFSVGCASNTDTGCFCPSTEYVNLVFGCISAHGASDEEVFSAQVFFQGICAPYIPSNPAIVTGATTVTISAPVQTVPCTTIQVVTSIVVAVTSNAAGASIPTSSSTTVVSTVLTVPQVVFTTMAGGASGAQVSLVPGTPAAVTVAAGKTGSPSATGPVAFTGSASRTSMGFGCIAAAILFALAVM